MRRVSAVRAQRCLWLVMLRETMAAAKGALTKGGTCVHAGKVISAEVPAGAALSLPKIKDELAKHKPAVLFLCQVCQRTTSLTVAKQCAFGLLGNRQGLRNNTSEHDNAC